MYAVLCRNIHWCLIRMEKITEIVTENESIQDNTSDLIQNVGIPSSFWEEQSNRVLLCSTLRQTISLTKRYLEGCKIFNPVVWCENFLGGIGSDCEVQKTAHMGVRREF